MSVLSFTALGRPAPQGSKRAVPTKAGVRLIEQSKGVAPYRQAVAAAALSVRIDDALRDGLLAGPVAVTVTFCLARPAGHHRTGRHHPLLRPSAPSFPGVAPDLDKLCRAAIDGLAMSGLIRNDAQVVSLGASKVYADPGAPECTVIEAWPLPRTISEREADPVW